jgi:hypothetical protein
MKNESLPPLITTGSASDAVPGAVGQPNTVLVFGGTVDREAHAGGRFGLGYWFTDEHTLGVEGNLLILEGRTAQSALPRNATGKVVARPFLDAVTGTEMAEQISSPGQFSGNVFATASSQFGASEFNFRHEFCCGPCWTIGLLTGCRYALLHEDIVIGEQFQVAQQVPVFGAGQVQALEQFRTRNDFVGGQLGIDTELHYEHFFLNIHGKLALGPTYQSVTITGLTAPTSAVGPRSGVLFTSLLALPTNIGTRRRSPFSMVPEFGVTVGTPIGCHWRIDVGYSLLYMTNVARPASQIDRTVNTTQIPTTLGPGTLFGPPRPAFTFQESSFWMQGLTLNLEFLF